MAERKPLKNRGRDGKRRGKRGGKRNGAGRRLGSENEAKSVARAQAKKKGRLPHELLLEWATTGEMSRSPLALDSTSEKSEEETIVLSARERISCARACAAYYQHPKAPTQPTDAPAPVIRLELDQSMLRALARKRPDQLEVFRDVLKALQSNEGDLEATAIALGGPAIPLLEAPDANRYASSLTEDNFEGSA